MKEPTYEEVIDAIADLPFPCYHGKDRDGVLEIHIPIARIDLPMEPISKIKNQ